MGSSTLSFRVDDQIIDALDELATESNVSRSQVARDLLLEAVETTEEVPDHVRHEAETRRMIQRNKAERRKGKFRSEFSKQLKSSFSNNETPAEFRSSVSGYLEESERLGAIPQDVRESMDSDAVTYREWCEEMIRYYSVAYEAQEFDHDPIDDPLSNHEGIENAKEWVDRAERIEERANGSGHSVSAHEIAQTALTDGVVPEHVEQQAQQHEHGVLDGLVDQAEAAVAEDRALTDSDSDTNQLEER